MKAQDKNGVNKYINPALIKGTIRANKKFLIIWLSVIIAVILLEFSGFLIIRSIDMTEMFYEGSKLINPAFTEAEHLAYAEEMERVRLIQFEDLSRYFVSSNIGNLILACMIMMPIMAMAALLKDEKSGTTEFLFSHPISRKKMYFTQYLTTLSQVAIVMGVLMTGSFIMLVLFNGFDFNVNWGQFFACFGVLTLLALVFATFFYGWAGFIKKKGYLGIAIGVPLLFYFAQSIFTTVFSNLKELYKGIDKLNYIFPQSMISFNQNLNIIIDWIPALIWSLLSIAMLVGGYFVYTKKDLNCASG